MIMVYEDRIINIGGEPYEEYTFVNDFVENYNAFKNDVLSILNSYSKEKQIIAFKELRNMDISINTIMNDLFKTYVAQKEVVKEMDYDK